MHARGIVILAGDHLAERQDLAIGGSEQLGVLARQDIEDGLAAQLIFADALDALELPIDELISPLDVLEVDQHRRVVHEGAHARLAVAQRLLRPLEGADVDGDAADRHHRPAGVPDRELDLVAPLDPRAIGEMQLALDGRARRQHGSVVGLDDRGIVARQEVGRAMADDVLGLATEELGVVPIEHGEAAVEILHEHPDGGIVHEGAHAHLAVTQRRIGPLAFVTSWSVPLTDARRPSASRSTAAISSTQMVSPPGCRMRYSNL